MRNDRDCEALFISYIRYLVVVLSYPIDVSSPVQGVVLSRYYCRSGLCQRYFPIMSSLRNSLHRRNHKERSQLSNRARLGILEKHKDYVQRARDYHSKQDRIRKLKEKASVRNKDEFYFGMKASKTTVSLFVHCIQPRINVRNCLGRRACQGSGECCTARRFGQGLEVAR